MGVKRFDFIQDHERRDSWMEEAALGQYIKSADFDGLAARCDARGEHIEILEARVAALEAALRGARDTLREIEPIVKHEYSLARIRISEKECVAALAPAETPVSTLCAVCDQIKELHPNTHPWTAKTQSETKEMRMARKREWRMWMVVCDGVGPIDTLSFNMRRSALDYHRRHYSELPNYRVQRVRVSLDTPSDRGEK